MSILWGFYGCFMGKLWGILLTTLTTIINQVFIDCFIRNLTFAREQKYKPIQNSFQYLSHIKSFLWGINRPHSVSFFYGAIIFFQEPTTIRAMSNERTFKQRAVVISYLDRGSWCSVPAYHTWLRKWFCFLHSVSSTLS